MFDYIWPKIVRISLEFWLPKDQCRQPTPLAIFQYIKTHYAHCISVYQDLVLHYNPPHRNTDHPFRYVRSITHFTNSNPVGYSPLHPVFSMLFLLEPIVPALVQ
jgi:hypothetical protein